MRKPLAPALSGRSGHSLIDVLAVLGAIFVTSTLIIVAMNRARISSRRQHSERQLQQMFQGMEQYVSTYRTLPVIPRPAAGKRLQPSTRTSAGPSGTR